MKIVIGEFRLEEEKRRFVRNVIQEFALQINEKRSDVKSLVADEIVLKIFFGKNIYVTKELKNWKVSIDFDEEGEYVQKIKSLIDCSKKKKNI
jgi:hypothetical protein